ncbi:MAG TPA: formaldehyde-activating enzyme [Methanocorpusculum sp.]|nr:formaldehyde-activating enzyme [Methanocorpusculum sp.]
MFPFTTFLMFLKTVNTEEAITIRKIKYLNNKHNNEDYIKNGTDAVHGVPIMGLLQSIDNVGEISSPFNNVMFGEALVGEGAEVAHIDLVIGPKGSSVEQAFVTALASPQRGHTPLLAVITPNLPPKPATLMVNKVTIKNVTQATMMFGPAQHAVAMAVVDSVEEGIIPKEVVEEVLIIASVFIEWDATDKKKVHDWNYEATKLAIKRAITGNPKIDEILAKKNAAIHPFS